MLSRTIIPTTTVAKAIPRIGAAAAAAHAASWASSPSCTPAVKTFTRRYFTAKPPPGDPLDILRDGAERLMLCDHGGVRNAGQHWIFQIAVARKDDPARPPNLRTVNFQRVTPEGIDFVMKRSDRASASNALLKDDPPVSVCYTAGEYRPGETVEQWRGEGHCVSGDLSALIPVVPHHTIVGMLASKRASRDLHKVDDIVGDDLETEELRVRMEKHSRFIELVQNTRREFENGNVSQQEIEDSVAAFTFVPNRMERILGSPDQVAWDRWEWVRESADKPWEKARHLLPF